MHYLIDDTQVTKILNFLDTIKGIHKKNKLRLRVFIDAVYYIIRIGCQWRLLPFYYGDWRAIAEPLYADIHSARMIADKGYDSDACIQFLRDKKCDPTILPRKNRKELRYYDEFLYQERHPIECFFSKIKHFRRVFSRYDKSAQAYLAILHFVGVLIWIR